MSMSNEKKVIKPEEHKHESSTNGKKLMNPGEIKGKIDVHDTRERRDGPGGE